MPLGTGGRVRLLQAFRLLDETAVISYLALVMSVRVSGKRALGSFNASIWW